MARQLAEQGDRPAFLALLDSPGPGQMPRRFADDAELLAAAFTTEADAVAEQLRTMAPEEMMRHVLSLARAGGAVPADFELVDLGVFLNVWKAHTRALYSYVPKPYGGPVHYFRAQDTVPPHPAHPERPWQTLLGRDLTVVPVPGDHQSMVEPPHVATLAGLLARAIRDHAAASSHPPVTFEDGETR
jgi:thioesterase domain-containing protein